MMAHIKADSRGQWFILADGDLADAQVSGSWLKTTDAVEVRP